MPRADTLLPDPPPRARDASSRFRGRRPAAVGVLTVVFGAVVGVACSDFEDLRVAASDAGNGADATIDAPSVGDLDAGCMRALPPGRSGLSTFPGGDADFSAVVSSVNLGDALDGGPAPYHAFGYDLDNACSTADGGSSCIEPSWASRSHADGPGGIDNAFGEDLFTLNQTMMGSATGLVQSDRTGVLQLLIRVRNYNGRTVQGQVDVAVYGVGFRPTADASVAAFDGTDTWNAFSTWLASPDGGGPYDLDAPRYEDPNAYITNASPNGNGELVAQFTNLLVGGAPAFLLSNVVMTAEISKSGDTWALHNGVFAGRLLVNDLVHSLATISDNATGTFYCQGQGNYFLAKAFTCAFPDINYEGVNDGSAHCDALSWAWQFDTVPATLVGIVPSVVPVEPSSCEAGKSPTEDRCGP